MPKAPPRSLQRGARVIACHSCGRLGYFKITPIEKLLSKSIGGSQLEEDVLIICSFKLWRKEVS
jgi:hypothetical protein